MNVSGIVNFANDIIDQNYSLLIVCNTKNEAAEIYNKIDNAETKYYLSSAMCTNHRKVIVAKIKNDLDNNVKVVCVSTQVIEAGVNISFERVIRLQAGLDSIIQTAGRCNRHGECDIGYIYIIKLNGEKLTMLPDIENGKNATSSLLVETRYNDKYKDLMSIVDSYKDIADYKLIFTKLDETSSYGNLLNVKLYSQANISYVTNGQNVPDDIEIFNTQKIVKQLLGGSR